MGDDTTVTTGQRPGIDSTRIKELTWLCRRAGERFDLVQAAGGNASFRSADETLTVKGSGVALSAVTEDSGFAVMDNRSLLDLLHEMSGQRTAVGGRSRADLEKT
ncbi:MAG: class II aldolase/adducin family protein, partial [Terriglobales bacterium]